MATLLKWTVKAVAIVCVGFTSGFVCATAARASLSNAAPDDASAAARGADEIGIEVAVAPESPALRGVALPGVAETAGARETAPRAVARQPTRSRRAHGAHATTSTAAAVAGTSTSTSASAHTRDDDDAELSRARAAATLADDQLAAALGSRGALLGEVR